MTTAESPARVDAAAIERVLAGDGAAFGELVRRHQRSIFFLCLRYLRIDEDAADMTQRVFLRAYEKLGSFQGRSAFKTWVYRIAVNLCLNAIRDRARRPTVPLKDDGAGLASVDANQLGDASRAEERRRLRDAVDLLPPKQRMTVILRVYHDLPFKEVAAMMDSSLGSVKVNYHHAMKRLKVLLAPETDDE